MNECNSALKKRSAAFFNQPLTSRVVSLDLVRGFAIFSMTVFHQSLVIQLDGDWLLFANFLGFIAAPLFLIISGAAVAFHEHRYHWPFKMIVHGGLLFALAYCLDVFAHLSWQVDWDVFQVIGACYAGLGLFDYLGYGWCKFVALAVVLLGLAVFPAVRPDQGVFPVWPFGLYFISGYLVALLGLNSGLRRRLIWGLAIVGFGCFLAFFSWDPTPGQTRPEGFVFLLALFYLMLLATLKIEKRGLLKTRGLAVLISWGQYSLTLYFMQQFVTVTRLCLPLPLSATWAWIVQSAVLLALLYTATLLMKRYAFLDVGWWLRQAEQRVMKRTPAKGHLSPN